MDEIRDRVGAAVVSRVGSMTTRAIFRVRRSRGGGCRRIAAGPQIAQQLQMRRAAHTHQRKRIYHRSATECCRYSLDTHTGDRVRAGCPCCVCVCVGVAHTLFWRNVVRACVGSSYLLCSIATYAYCSLIILYCITTAIIVVVNVLK
jgi:hypothetical protein